MAVVGPAFFDTTVLLGGLIELGGPDDPPQRLFAAVADGSLREPRTAWHCCLEFYAVSTRLPEDLRISPAESLQLIEEEILGRFRVHQLPDGVRRRFLAAAARDRVAGGRIYDAHIAEIALRAAAKVVVTDNRRHFTALLAHHVRVLTSEELAQELGV